MTNETLKKHEKLCDICQITNPENKIGKQLATKANKRNLENNDNGLCLNAPNKNKPKKQITGELYDTQDIEGLARAGDSKKQTIKEHETSIIDIREPKKQTVEERRNEYLNALHSEDTMPPKKEKQTGREWIIQYFIEWNFGASDLSFGTQELHHAIDLTEAEEREKCKYDFGKMFVDAAKDAEEKGRRETAKEIFGEIEKGFFSIETENAEFIFKQDYAKVKARFLRSSSDDLLRASEKPAMPKEKVEQ